MCAAKSTYPKADLVNALNALKAAQDTGLDVAMVRITAPDGTTIEVIAPRGEQMMGSATNGAAPAHGPNEFDDLLPGNKD
jgi:hypothetical protein